VGCRCFVAVGKHESGLARGFRLIVSLFDGDLAHQAYAQGVPGRSVDLFKIIGQYNRDLEKPDAVVDSQLFLSLNSGRHKSWKPGLSEYDGHALWTRYASWTDLAILAMWAYCETRRKYTKLKKRRMSLAHLITRVKECRRC
jgi:hypothetical protein